MARKKTAKEKKVDLQVNLETYKETCKELEKALDSYEESTGAEDLINYDGDGQPVIHPDAPLASYFYLIGRNILKDAQHLQPQIIELGELNAILQKGTRLFKELESLDPNEVENLESLSKRLDLAGSISKDIDNIMNFKKSDTYRDSEVLARLGSFLKSFALCAGLVTLSCVLMIGSVVGMGFSVASLNVLGLICTGLNGIYRRVRCRGGYFSCWFLCWRWR